MAEAPAVSKIEAETRLQEVAYHHEPYWSPGKGDWIKSLLLFFDGVALLVPDYMYERPLFTDPLWPNLSLTRDCSTDSALRASSIKPLLRR